MPQTTVSEFAPRVRKDFSKFPRVIDIPNLLEIQKESFERFLQPDVAMEKRESVGLQAVFNSVFPIKDFNDTASLEFVGYTLEQPKYDVNECLSRGMTYAAPFKVTIRLVAWDEAGGSQTIRDVKEQEVYFGEIPIMTDNGTFIINGTERVIVSQLHRSPGIFFDTSLSTTVSAAGKKLYSCRIIPYRGSWLDVDFDHKDIIHARIDRRRKIHVTVLLRALGYTPEEMLSFFYTPETIKVDGKKYMKKVVPELLIGQRATKEVRDSDNNLLVKKDRKFTAAALRKIEAAKGKWIQVTIDDLIRPDAVKRVAPVDIVDESTGEVIIECNEELTQAHLDDLKERGINQFDLLYLDPISTGTALRDTLLADKTLTQEEAIIEIYRRLRPGDPPTLETATNLFNNLFFNPERYDLSRVGRLKVNHKLSMDPEERVVWQPTGVGGPEEEIELGRLPTLRRDDILAAVKYLVDLKNGTDADKRVDDIDHLGNRRVRVVGELLENQYRIGLVRMERAIKERMSLQEIETLMPHDLINSKPVSAVIKEFFGSSQLSQFMDQTNPLSSVTHKRRLSALGPGGLTRERAGFEVRDVHPTHYGRICPIETPEGPNNGLIASLSTYARVNDFGFIETPYRVVEDGTVKDEVKFLSALEEERIAIAQASAPIDEAGKFVNPSVSARQQGEFMMVPPDDISMMDVSPNQLVSVAASLIPFLENDDANRALMGSNMMRQAVPLLRPNAPLVGTGMEATVARDSGVTVVAKHDGVVESVDSGRIVVKPDDEKGAEASNVDIINLIKYQRSNQNTCINQRPIVRLGDRVSRGQVIADGPATDRGEMALGCNVRVAFMPWGGYNFEDSILISERVVKEDLFTSIHIEEFECVARDTKLGKEEITRDIPNVGEEALADLDESGIVRIGAEVKQDDILVGKITPKGETQLSPEERLLRAIFGEKAGDVRDTSLRVPPGVRGTVIGAQVFSRRGVEKDERARALEEEEIEHLRKDQADEVRIIRQGALSKVRDLLTGKVAANSLMDERRGVELVAPGTDLTPALLGELPDRRYRDIQVKDKATQGQIDRLFSMVEEQANVIKTVFDEKIARLKKGDELPPGVFKMVKIYIAIKRKLSVGDKMAGRHGNKGVISRIMAEEDMPYLADGSPVDVCLNPLGVPSRMNVGQILETHLGWAAHGLGMRIGELMENAVSTEVLREKLKHTYGEEVGSALDQASDEAVRDLAHNVRSGIHVASNVFDGASEHQVKEELARAGLRQTGQTILFDGRSGEPFDMDVTVGIMYMLKLHHLADDKIHARSIGPYSLVTQQPLGGKAQFGGQRLGEMEVWAMEAYGAAYGLQEFLTVKSDDVLGRTRIYESIVKGENTLEPGLPESFNVLIKELHALGLNLELMEDSQN